MTYSEPQASGGGGVGRKALIVGAVLVLVVGALIGVVITLVTGRDNATPAQTPALTPTLVTTATESSMTAAPSSSANTTAEPAPGGTLADGCLGGADPIKGILPAQQQAPITETGAAGFAHTFARWAVTFPFDTAAASVIDAVTTKDGVTRVTAMDGLIKQAQTLESKGYIAVKPVPGTAEYRMVGDLVADDGKVVSGAVLIRMESDRTKSDGTTDRVQMVAMVSLNVDTEGHWLINSSSPPVGDPDASGPTRWLPFSGGC